MTSPIILVEILSIAVLFGSLQAGKTRHCCERVKNLESQLFSCHDNMDILQGKTAGRQAGKPSRDILCSDAAIQKIEHMLHLCLQAEKTVGKKYCSDQLKEALASCTRRSTKLVEKTAAQRGQAADFNENPDWPWGRHIECEDHNEEFDPCASHCGEYSCGSDPSELRECILSCNPSCVCKKGYIRHEGECISRAKCDLLIREKSQI